MILTLFYVFAAAMTALLGYVLLRSVLSPSARDETNHRDVNIGIARDRQSLIKDALSKGHIDQETYEIEKQDIESTLATELAEGPNTSQSRVMRGGGVLFLVAITLAVSVLLYQRLGSEMAMQDTFLADTGAVIMANGATVPAPVAAALNTGADPRTVAETVARAQAEAAQTQSQAQAGAQSGDQSAAGSLQDLLPQLEARLEDNPDDLQGWTLLGRTYMNIGEFAKAQNALERVNELEPNNPEMIIMLAEAGALQNDGDLTGDAQELIKKALTVDPNYQRAQLLMGLSHQQLGEHEQALTIFLKLRENPNLNEQAVANLTQMVNQSRAALGQPMETAAALDTDASANAAQSSGADQSTDAGESTVSTASTNSNSEGAGASSELTTATGTDVDANSEGTTRTEIKADASISVRVSLAESVQSQVNPTDSVFVFATASSGPPMPLAVVRLTVAQLPTTVQLDESQAMIPNMTLSAFPSVTIGARVSKSGNAIAQTGDWFGEKLNVEDHKKAYKDAINIVIDQQVP